MPILKNKELCVFSPLIKQSSSAILFIGEKTCSYLEKMFSKLIPLGVNVGLVLGQYRLSFPIPRWLAWSSTFCLNVSVACLCSTHSRKWNKPIFLYKLEIWKLMVHCLAHRVQEKKKPWTLSQNLGCQFLLKNHKIWLCCAYIPHTNGVCNFLDTCFPVHHSHCHYQRVC